MQKYCIQKYVAVSFTFILHFTGSPALELQRTSNDVQRRRHPETLLKLHSKFMPQFIDARRRQWHKYYNGTQQHQQQQQQFNEIQ